MHETTSGEGATTGAPFPFTAASSHWFLILIAAELVIVAVALAVLWETGHTGAQLSLIPTLVALTASKFFGNKKDEDLAFGEHPAVRFTFRALATGDYEGLHEMVAVDFSAYANGYPMVEAYGGNGPARFAENIEFWRSVVPDLEVDIYDEVSQTESDKTNVIAVRFVVSGTFQAADVNREFEVEAAAFITVVDEKLTEWRVVVETSFLDDLRSAMGHPLP